MIELLDYGLKVSEVKIISNSYASIEYEKTSSGTKSEK